MKTIVLQSKPAKSDSTGPQNNQDKIKTYKWTVVDRPGEFAMINKNDLHIDHTYQRGLNNERALKYASEWSWLACGALTVTLREDGDWYVIDGQHRLEAAKKRSDITALPCLAFETSEVRQEAHGFLQVNITRRPMSSIDRYHAMLADQDPSALELETLALSIGRVVRRDSSKNTVSCVAIMLDSLKSNRDVVVRLFPLLSKLCHDQPFSESLVKGAIYLESKLDAGNSLTLPRNSKRLVTLGYSAILDSIRKSTTFFGSLNKSNCAVGIVQIFNKGLRTNKLPSDNLKYESTINPDG